MDLEHLRGSAALGSGVTWRLAQRSAWGLWAVAGHHSVRGRYSTSKHPQSICGYRRGRGVCPHRPWHRAHPCPSLVCGSVSQPTARAAALCMPRSRCRAPVQDIMGSPRPEEERPSPPGLGSEWLDHAGAGPDGAWRGAFLHWHQPGRAGSQRLGCCLRAAVIAARCSPSNYECVSHSCGFPERRHLQLLGYVAWPSQGAWLPHIT